MAEIEPFQWARKAFKTMQNDTTPVDKRTKAWKLVLGKWGEKLKFPY
jgi:hypothetical protein